MQENIGLNIDKSDWKPTPLGDLATEISKRVDNPASSPYDRFVGLEHFVSGDIKIEAWSNTDNLVSSAKAFQSGDILFARRNAYLRRASMVDFDGCCSGDAFVLREDYDEVIPGFLAFLMNSNALWNFANSNAAGTMSKRVKWRDLANYEFLLPPKDQQAQLSELLWAIDEVVEREKELLRINLALLKVVRETRVHSKKFGFKPLHEGLIDIIAGKSLNGENNPVKNRDKGVLKVSAVGNKGFVPNENKRLNDQSGFLEKFKVMKGDLLITRANTTELVGRTCVVDQSDQNLMLSDKTLRLDLNGNVNVHFVAEALRTKYSRIQIESYATGTGGAMKNITQNEISSIKIPFPDKTTQDEIASTILTIKKNDKLIEQKIGLTQSLQKSLINQIFS